MKIMSSKGGWRYKSKSTLMCGKVVQAPKGDYYVTCSFDKNHIVLRSRMPYHIIKCLKQHPGHNKIQCPYDATEYIDSNEYKDHLLKCESRRSYEDEKFAIAKLKASGQMCNIKETPYVHASGFEQEEEWGGPAVPEVVEDYNEDCFENLCSRAVGRGIKMRNRNDDQKPRKGMGRAEVLQRIFDKYYESQASSSSLSTSSSDSLRQHTTEGQFDDE